MKREIEFRGKQSNTGEWVYGMFITIRNVFYDEDTEEKTMFIDSQWIAGCEAIGECWVEVIPETVGQFTGLTDKNCTAIFEGDILTSGELYGSNHEMTFAMEWDNERARFSDYSPRNSFIVIGNIHDNPELLK